MRESINKRIGTVILIIVVALLNVMIVIQPAVALSAARWGLSLWFNSVLPGILPFLIGVNVLMAFGAVKHLGVLLSFAMKRLFRLPGSAGFALVMGTLSGYPVGAKIVCQMRAKGDLSRSQAQRLLGFSNNAGPLFILGAVGAGMFASPAFGYLLLAGHYAGALGLGLLLRLFAKNKENHGILPQPAPNEAANTRLQPIGKILGSSVKNAMETMLIIGGFIVLFSVISALISHLPFIGSQLATPIAGAIEMTGGLGTLSEGILTRAGAVFAAAILGFGGLSILFQALSFIDKTDLSPALYILCKMVHAALAALVTFLLYPLFAQRIESQIAQTTFATTPTATQTLVSSASIFGISLVVILAICAVIIFKASKKN